MENTNDEFIIKNMKLVGYAIKRYIKIFPNEDVDDYCQIGYIGLIKAQRTFNVERSSWSSYAIRCIVNEILMYKRKNKKYNNQIYLDDSIKDTDENLTYVDMLSDIDAIDNFIIVDELKRNMLTVLNEQTPKNKAIIEHYLKTGCKQEELSNIFGVQQAQISRVLKRYKDKVKEAIQ